jgi:hypothetical protein
MADQQTREQQRLTREGMARHLAELDAEINRLNALADQAQGDEKRDYEERVARLRARHIDLNNRMHRMEESAMDWEAFSSDLQQAWNELRQAFQR